MNHIHRSRGTIAAFAAAAALLTPAVADAATRYASPTGSAPPALNGCLQSAPCSLTDAVNGTGVADGDTIRLLGGTYSLGGVTALVFHQLTIEPEPGAAPVIENTNAPAFHVDTGGAGSVIRGLVINVDNAGSDAVHVQGGGTATLERLRITASGASSLGVQLRGTIRDSTIWFQGAAGGAGVLPCCNSTSTMRNVTVIATTAGAYGVAMYEGFGPSATVNLRNVIARGPGGGILVDDDDGVDGDDNLTANIGFSNYSSVSDDSSPDSVVIDAGGNQTGAPLFNNAATGDFRQKPGSPTLNAGTVDGLIRSVDLDGQPRIQGPAIDIGADEATDPDSLFAFANIGKLKRKRTLRIPASCPIVNCNAAVAANLVVKGAAKSASTSRVIKLKDQNLSLTAGTETALVYKLSKKAFKRLEAAAKARLTLAATAIDAVGFTGTKSASFKFKKAKK